MNKTSITLAVSGLILLAGFLYLRSKPVPEKPSPPNQAQQAKDIIDQSLTNLQNTTMGKPSTATYSQPEMIIDQNKKYTAILTTDKGPLTIELFTDQTPKTVNNFVFLAKQKFYDNTKFHRIISGFMIQGGDPLGDGTGGPGYQIDDEPFTGNYSRGIIAMANTNRPNTGGSQFFIMHQDYPLDPTYTIFGQLTGEASFQTLDDIADTPVSNNPISQEPSVPQEDIFIQSIQIIEE